MAFQVETFVKQCQLSSSCSYEQFKKLLIALEDESTRQSTFFFLSELYDYCVKTRPRDSHFQFLNQKILDDNDNSVELKLLQFPSTFLPEAWSFTFYEGLVRNPANEYRNKKITELGCGIGWISIALAFRYSPEIIIGLDINPKAIACARLNLYLNAFNADGSLREFSNGRALTDMVSFYESNLFSHFNESQLEIDRIIGCIPQVLNPEPEVMEDLIAENASDSYLHSLSNYFAKQGYIEDQFGLGLIASAVEQSIPLLKASGKLILNLGGRPGRLVLERLMQRRGFKVRRVWQTQVEQAADTDIRTLVDIEKNTGHRFEFYMSTHSDTPIDARTALEYSKTGGKIYHSVDVYEAQMLFPEQVKSIFSSVDTIGGQSLRSAVDLTYDNYDDAEERYSFLAFLASQLHKMTHFPYLETAGIARFRQQLAEYFRYYLRVDISDKQVVITPGRRELITNILTNYGPSRTLVAKPLVDLVDKRFDESCQILETPSKVEYLVELMEKLKPLVVITKLDRYEILSSHLVEKLIHCAKSNKALLILDLTDNIDLSSEPEVHGVYRYLSDYAQPPNLIIMAALVNNRVYQDYTLNITLTSNDSLVNHLVDAAELTYSRTPLFKQIYYAHLLEQLLFFQRTRATLVSRDVETTEKSARELTLCSAASYAFSHPSIVGNHLPFDKNTVRLDFGENELAAPKILKQELFESYLVRKWLPSESSAEIVFRELLERRFNLSRTLYAKVVFGNGVAPLFSALLNLCALEQQTLVIPSGSYGYFKAAAQYQGVEVYSLNTDEVDRFKVTSEKLKECLEKRPGSWLFLNAPVINPTGEIYSQSELNQLLAIAAANQTTVIMDCIFNGLEFGHVSKLESGIEEEPHWSINQSVQAITHSKQAKFVLLGGISKEFAAGGLRFGYAWSTSQEFMQALERNLPHTPHFTLSYTVRKLIEAQLRGDSDLLRHQNKQRQELQKRAEVLADVLTEKGWHVIPPRGGLFLVAKPQSFIESSQLSVVEAGNEITRQLFKEINLVINNSTWTGLPGYCRFVLSCSAIDFEQAIERLKHFSLP